MVKILKKQKKKAVKKVTKKSPAKRKPAQVKSKKKIKKVVRAPKKAKPKTTGSSKTKPKRKTVKKSLKRLPATLKRPLHNPLIKPSFYPWESKATFNPSAFESDGKIHIIYRAIGDNDSSALGYASSYDGLNIEDRPTYAIYHRFYDTARTGERIDYISGGGWGGGCEDPRVTLLSDTVYMLYTAFDGWGSVRIAMTSISLPDFKKKKWNWAKPVMISPPGQIHKNWVIFPEKINGKFAILHRIAEEIGIEYVKDLREFDGTKFIQSTHSSKPAWQADSWDNMVRGVGPAPIKTSLGWLVLYHSMDRNDPDRYKLGAIILDSKNPTKILYHSKHPILEPDEHYENEGHKSGVIYSCGAVVKDGTLFVYYGGADKFVCVASIELLTLLESLKKDKMVKLKNNNLKSI